MSEELFGNYLLSVQERDIDLLLMEEFQVSDEFVSWFCDCIGLESVEFLGAWHSVSDGDGETDLLLTVRVNSQRIAVMIENKVGACEQAEQDARYHKRGKSAVNSGTVDDYLTVICAPGDYLAALPNDSQYQYKISYEDIAGWFAGFDDKRSAWRRRIFYEAIGQGRRGYSMIKNPQITDFHMGFWKYLRASHSSLLMNKPGAKGGKSSWIITWQGNFPKGVKLHFKFDLQVVELGFEGQLVEALDGAISELPAGAYMDQKGKTAVLALPIPPIDVRKTVSEQTEAIEKAIESAFRLSPYANVFKD